MNATTIKIDGPILKALKEFKRSDQSLSALIRELLEAELRHRRMALAAGQYLSFVRENPAEYSELDAWASAPLERDPGEKKKRK